MKYEFFNVGEDEIKIPFPTSYKDCALLAQSDYFRYVGKVVPIWKIYFSSIYSDAALFCFWFRMAQHRKGLFYYYSMWRYIRLSRKRGIQISPKMKVGLGFYLGHLFGIIINPTTKIGNNCNLSQFTNIGSNKWNAAVIGDNVYIAPSVCLVENVHIGSNVSIGAGSVVVKDISKNATAAGVPAKVLNYNNPGRFVNRRWCVS